MERVYLSMPTLALQSEYLSFYEEWRESGEDMVPWVIEKDPSDFPAMIRFLMETEKGLGLPETWVPSSTFWLVTEDRKVVGAVNIRHRLTQKLLNCGGHIGYGIRPSERRKGYATKILSFALEKAQELDLHKVLVVCDADNIGSEKTILKNGGLRDADFVDEKGLIVKRFWITIGGHSSGRSN